MTKEIKIAPITMGGGKAGALSNSPPPVPVNDDVYVSASKPYTFRLNIALQNRLAAYCERKGRGKGPAIDEAVEQWLDTHEGEG
jgi:hypothetical protein